MIFCDIIPCVQKIGGINMKNAVTNLKLIPEFPISTILSEIKDSTSFFIPINAINVNFECSFKAILLRLKSSF